jgi:uncharacterized membrane protein YeaQ/YmgE (transglycosylase-associated protein family)
MDKVNAALGAVAAALGTDVLTLGVWAGAGFVLSLILIGRRPLGLAGDVLLGVAGGIGGGWAAKRFGIDLSVYALQIAPSLSENAAGVIGAFAEAFVGALIPPVLARLVIRR